MIEVRVDGRPVLTTAQAAERRGVKPRSFAAWASRHGVKPVAHLDPRTPLWDPKDLEEES